MLLLCEHPVAGRDCEAEREDGIREGEWGAGRLAGRRKWGAGGGARGVDGGGLERGPDFCDGWLARLLLPLHLLEGVRRDGRHHRVRLPWRFVHSEVVAGLGSLTVQNS